MDAEEFETVIRQLKSSRTDNRSVEVKESVGKMPSTIAETISAFANGSGGTIVLGLSEKNDFEPAKDSTPAASPTPSRRRVRTSSLRPFAPT